jgi:hypothetical protein
MVFLFQKNLICMDITNGGKCSTNFENPIVARFRVLIAIPMRRLH